MDQQAAVGEAPSVHQPGKWVESASIDGERWVDSSDAVAMDAWGTAAPPAPKAIFDPQKAAQQKMKPQRRTSLTMSDMALGSQDQRQGSISSLQQREEIIQQGTHQQTHPRQQQRWTPSPALSPAMTPAREDSSRQTSEDASEEDAGAAAEVTTFPASAVVGEALPVSAPQADLDMAGSGELSVPNLQERQSGARFGGPGPPSHALNGARMEHHLSDSGSDADSSEASEGEDNIDGDAGSEGDDGDIPIDVAKALGPDNLMALKEMGGDGLSGAFRLPAGFAREQDARENGDDDGDGSSATENMGGSSDDDLDADYDPAYATAPKCINCTAPLFMDAVCSECGHDPEDDDALFSTEQQQQHGPGLFAAVAQEGMSPGTTLLAYDERMTLHEEDAASPHPERPDRIRAVIARLLSTGLADRCRQMSCREATAAEIEACHQPALVRAVQALSAAAAGSEGEPSPPAYFTQDTYINASTFLCARLAAGGCIDVAAAVAGGAVQNGAAIVRPPGHHAESGMAMGFCYFNNAGLAARAAQAAGARRVLVLDWDVHHGNGTQHIFEHDPGVMYMSIHRYDGGHFYPGTGAVKEVGRGAGEGFTVNVPWPMGGMGNGDYMAAFSHVIIPIAHEYSPDLIIVSAGFDASAGDPIGGCRVTPEAYAHMTAMLGAVAPLAVLLEGGYNLTATAAGCEAVLRVLLGAKPPRFAKPAVPCTAALMALQQVVAVQGKYWRCLRGLSEQAAFNPYSTPYALTGRHASLDADQLSPRQPAKKPRPAPAADAGWSPGASGAQRGAFPPAGFASPSHAREGDSSRPSWPRGNGPASPRGVVRMGTQEFGPAAGSPGGVSRALHRTKFIAKRHRGKSQRRWQMLHALHLFALRDMIKRHYRKRSRQQTQAAHSQGSGEMGTPLNSEEGSP